jgi:hypothetical protein
MCAGSFCTHFVTSADEGATWTTADEALAAPGQLFCDDAPVPGGTTVFAVTSKGNCTWLDLSLRTLWRSDDAGGHWSRVGTLPFPNEHSIQAIAHPGAEPLLYAYLSKTVGTTTNKMGDHNPVPSDAADDLKVSADGGKTWKAAPLQGAPTAAKPCYAPMGLLDDGSVIVPFTPQGAESPDHMTFYAWKMGDASWRQVTPTVTQLWGESLVVTQSDGKDILWLVARSPNDTQTSEDGYYIQVFRP